jgi:glycosyltransferase involved in cell wall biosynthesis
VLNKKGDQLRILIVTGIFPPDLGGPATYVPKIAQFLANEGHSVTVITLSDSVEHKDAEEYSFELIRISRRMYKPLRWLLTISWIIRLGRLANIIFVNGLSMEAAQANLLIRKPLVIKVVGDLAWERAQNNNWVTETLDDFQSKRYGLKVELHRQLRTWWTQQADYIITPSHYLARIVHKWGVSKNKIRVIYNAIELPSEILSLPIHLNTTFKVVMVNRLVPWKHVNKAIEALNLIDDVGLIVVGDGPLKQKLIDTVNNLGLSDRVHFAGSCTKIETIGIIKACDTLLLNSSYEGLPHVVIEAMMLGVPVIATSVGGTPEIIENDINGKLITSGNLQELQSAVKSMRDNKFLREEITKNAYKRLEDFDINIMLYNTYQVLKEFAS